MASFAVFMATAWEVDTPRTQALESQPLNSSTA